VKDEVVALLGTSRAPNNTATLSTPITDKGISLTVIDRQEHLESSPPDAVSLVRCFPRGLSFPGAMLRSLQGSMNEATNKKHLRVCIGSNYNCLILTKSYSLKKDPNLKAQDRRNS
jgi:hypothetical protein